MDLGNAAGARAAYEQDRRVDPRATEATPVSSNGARLRGGFALVVVIATTVAYYNALHTPFIFDDHQIPNLALLLRQGKSEEAATHMAEAFRLRPDLAARARDANAPVVGRQVR